MRVLVAYGSRYGSTEGIARKIAEKLQACGHDASAVRAKDVLDTGGYDAFVIGSAVYMGAWMKDVSEFARRNAHVLAERPVWLFSSGPVGTETVDAKGRDVREATVPKHITELEAMLHSRGHRVFFGALDHTKLNFAHRALFALPAGKKLLIEGDFRDWNEIDSWAESIAEALAPAHVL